MPFACALVVAARTVGSVLYDRPGQPIQYGAAVAVYTVAALGTVWQRRALLVAWVSGIVVTSFVAGDRDAVGVGFAVLTIGCAHAVGRLTAVRHEQVELAEREASRQARLAELESERAASAERQRIARVWRLCRHGEDVRVLSSQDRGRLDVIRWRRWRMRAACDVHGRADHDNCASQPSPIGYSLPLASATR